MGDTQLRAVSLSIGVIGTVWAGVYGATRSLLSGSANSAEVFQRLASDPMEALRQHFRDTIDDFDRPVMVFIDDLDRCGAARAGRQDAPPSSTSSSVPSTICSSWGPRDERSWHGHY